jgi:hypothetical protein
MKKSVFQVAMIILIAVSAIVLRTQSASAQVNMSLLNSIVKSCQKDINSSEYYGSMGIEKTELDQPVDSDSLLEACVKYRYRYTLVESKFPWLISTNELTSGYPGAAFIAILSNNIRSSLLDCLVNQDPSSNECQSSLGIFIDTKLSNYSYIPAISFNYIYTCPSCLVAHDNILSDKKMKENSIRWFLSLDKPRIRELMSLLGDDEIAVKNRSEISDESSKAVERYKEIRSKVRQQDLDQRRREILGN